MHGGWETPEIRGWQGKTLVAVSIFMLSPVSQLKMIHHGRRAGVEDFWIWTLGCEGKETESRVVNTQEWKIEQEGETDDTNEWLEKKKKTMFVKGCWETISFTFKSFIEAVANIALIHKPWPKYHHTVCIFHGLHPCLNHELHLKLIIHHRKNTQSCWINERTQWKWQSDRG